MWIQKSHLRAKEALPCPQIRTTPPRWIRVFPAYGMRRHWPYHFIAFYPTSWGGADRYSVNVTSVVISIGRVDSRLRTLTRSGSIVGAFSCYWVVDHRSERQVRQELYSYSQCRAERSLLIFFLGIESVATLFEWK